MALIHDIAEGIVGDFTPYDQITYTIFNLVPNKNFKRKNLQSNRYLSL